MNPINKNKPLRVLHIMSGYGGGISSFIRNKALGLTDQEIIFDVVTYDECATSFIEAIEATGGTVYRLINPKKEGWRAFRKSFVSVLKMHHYDVVHCHISGYRAISYRYLCQGFSIDKFYIHAHLAPLLEKMTLSKKVQHRMDQLTNSSLSDAYLGCSLQAIHSVFGHDIPDNQIMVIPNSIDSFSYILTKDEHQIFKQQNRLTYGFKKDALLIGQIARLEDVKNHKFTLRLAKYMEENQLTGEFVIVGEGSLRQQLEAEVRALNLSHRIHFLGRIQEIAKFYPMLDVVFLPSKMEGLPTVVVEAQASGVPVVMSDTITPEVDLGMNMVWSLNFEDSLAIWYQAILEASQFDVPNIQKRLNIIKEANFTNESSARLYQRFLRNEITSYQIGQNEVNA